MQLRRQLKIAAINTHKIETALLHENGRSRSFSFSTFEQLQTMTRRAESYLEDLGVVEYQRPGASIVAVSGHDMPHHFKRYRDGTRIKMFRRKTGWFLTEVEKVPFSNCEAGSLNLFLTRNQDQMLINRKIKELRENYEVTDEQGSN